MENKRNPPIPNAEKIGCGVQYGVFQRCGKPFCETFKARESGQPP